MQKVEIKAEKRSVVGKSMASVMSRGFLPAVVYGHNFKSTSVQVNLKDFERAYSEAGESSLVYMNLDNKDLPVIIHDVARNPISDRFIHADFYKVNLDEKITADVQLVFIGESAAVKDLAGILVKNVNEVKVEALPQDLPHEIQVDISALKSFANQILIKDLKLPKGVEVKEKPEEIIALVQEPISQEELDKQLAVPEAGVAEVEVIKKEKEAEEGEVTVADEGESGEKQNP
ncbi:MAG: 50S ribosomal protein L25 [Candidatus Yanofskybacteria bacterium]|nr:50S ribosomal protein L25 [Candidatus Yanofskybacteria bacterium]